MKFLGESRRKKMVAVIQWSGGRWRWERDGGVCVCFVWMKEGKVGDRSGESEIWGDIGEIVWLREVG